MPPQSFDFSSFNADVKAHRIHRFAHKAMATVFEVFIQHENAGYAQQAAFEAFHELDRLEQELSRFLPNSDISRINHLTQNETISLGEAAFECVQQCLRVHADTGGAFDITVGPLMDIWLNKDKSPRTPTPEELEAARQRVGMQHFRLEEAQYTITILSEQRVGVDLGAFGKGYAVDRLADLLREWSIATALIHGGMSSIFAMGAPFERMTGWPIAINNPWNRAQTVTTLLLRDRAVSGSGLQKGQHIIDPRTGHPVAGPRAAWAATASAAMSDGVSTAFMLMSAEEVERYCAAHEETWAMLGVGESQEEITLGNFLQFGNWSARQNA
ncbi:FAD:protein FMN transferase [candidate division KSB1 bacterium]|nr:FAD:protein FMN transferase [candidate division KSB1 bacterium]